MGRKFNVFISHFSKDDVHLQELKKRLEDNGCVVRNSSVEENQKTSKVPKHKTIERKLNRLVKWAGTFICLIGEDTYTRPWVNYEIEEAHKQGKSIIGIFEYGCLDSVKLPEAIKKYGSATIGWNSLDTLEDIMNGKLCPQETPSGINRDPISSIHRVICN